MAEAEAGPQEATIVTTFAKHHKGSVYCLRCGDNQHLSLDKTLHLSWSPDGSVLATGSNDSSLKLTRLPASASHQPGEMMMMMMMMMTCWVGL